MATPAPPDWIRLARVPGYVTAHELCPGETRLYGTESLYGHWDGAVLLLAKDFGPSRILHERMAKGDPRPYRHEPRMLTNRRLERLAEPLGQAGLLYGSALRISTERMQQPWDLLGRLVDESRVPFPR